MNFTTTTELAREWSKVFYKYDEAIVLNNNKNIWVIFGWKLAEAILDSWVVEQIREELWEMNDKDTVDTINSYRKWDRKNIISLSDYRKKYGV